ncbi:MAG: helix-hairpin-helix domain-containing protein [Candidatus Omnitrophica bacterium]|nr:helix-hairpin-helix domain-containing protein [Candidatus Omnitrophota bacterium]
MALWFLVGVSLLGLALLAWQRGRPPAPPPFVRLSVRVNFADAAELAALPGIGPKLAQRIVEDRRRHGRYLTLADLKRVKGVTAKTLGRIQGSVRFD